MEAVEHHFYVRMADVFDELHGFLTGIDEKVFETVHRLENQKYPVFPGEVGYAEYALDRAGAHARFVNRLAVIDRPIRVYDAAEQRGVDLTQGDKYASQQVETVIPHAFIGRRDVERGGQSDTSREGYSGILCRRFDAR